VVSPEMFATTSWQFIETPALTATTTTINTCSTTTKA
jgi:hypothetical protein